MAIDCPSRRRKTPPLMSRSNHRRGAGYAFAVSLALLWTSLSAPSPDPIANRKYKIANLPTPPLGTLAGDGSTQDGEELISLDSPEASPQETPRREAGPRRVFRDRIAPHWFHQNTRFWHRNDLRNEGKEFILVDAAQGRQGSRRPPQS